MDPNTLRQNFPDHWDKASAIRMLSVDAVEQANSGHPGMPMGMADVVTVLFEKQLKFLLMPKKLIFLRLRKPFLIWDIRQMRP